MYSHTHTCTHGPLGKSKEHLCVSIHLCDWISPGRPPSFTVSLTTVSPETLLSWCHVKRSSVAPAGLSTMGRGEEGGNTYDSQITSFSFREAKDNLAPSHTLLLKFLKWGFINNTSYPLHGVFKLTCDVDCLRTLKMCAQVVVYTSVSAQTNSRVSSSLAPL